MNPELIVILINALLTYVLLQLRDRWWLKKLTHFTDFAKAHVYACVWEEAEWHAQSVRLLLAELEKADTDPELSKGARAAIFTHRQILKHVLLINEQRAAEYKRRLPKEKKSPVVIGGVAAP